MFTVETPAGSPALAGSRFRLRAEAEEMAWAAVLRAVVAGSRGQTALFVVEGTGATRRTVSRITPRGVSRVVAAAPPAAPIQGR